MKYPYDMLDGVIVRFSCMGGTIQIVSIPVEKTKFGKVANLADGVAPFPAKAWHHIRITDDGVKISVFITGPSIDPKYEQLPILQLQVPEHASSHHVAFYNRELVADAVHESLIDNVEIRALLGSK